MDVDTPAQSGDTKPEIKSEGNSTAGNDRHGGSNNRQPAKKEKFLGADPDLQGFVFEAIGTRTQQATNFTTVDTQIKTIVGSKCDAYVLESIEKMTLTLPDEPDLEKIKQNR